MKSYAITAKGRCLLAALQHGFLAQNKDGLVTEDSFERFDHFWEQLIQDGVVLPEAEESLDDQQLVLEESASDEACDGQENVNDQAKPEVERFFTRSFVLEITLKLAVFFILGILYAFFVRRMG